MRPPRSLPHAARAGSTLVAAAALTLAGALSSSAGGAAVVPPSSNESCSIAAPAQVVVDKPDVPIRLVLSGDCPVGSVGGWELIAPGGTTVVQRVSLGTANEAIVRLTPKSALGTYRLRPLTASDPNYAQLVQNSPTISVGVRTTTTAKVTRAGKAVKVAVAVSSYAPAAKRAAPRAATVRIQRSTCASGCPWVEVTKTTTSAKGVATLSARANSASYLRIFTDGTATAWGSIGKAFRG